MKICFLVPLATVLMIHFCPAGMIPTPLPDHPRLLAARDDWQKIRAQIQSDPVSARIVQYLRARGDRLLSEPPVERVKIGRRLLAVSRAALERISTLAALACITGEERYAKRAAEEMVAICKFSDWNPSHFLDTAEMSLAMAIGYDWLYDRLSPAEREEVAEALLVKGIQPSLAEPEPNFIRAKNNWNQVCHAGMSAAAIAIAERNPELAEKVLQRAVEYLPLAAESYAPDGAYLEGPMYWGYGTLYHVVLISALERLNGSTAGLADYPGFAASADYMAMVTTPLGRFFNYSDCVPTRGLQAPLFWFAKHFQRPDWIAADLRDLDKQLARNAEKSSQDLRLLPLVLLWRLPSENAVERPPVSVRLRWLGKGKNPVAVFRSAVNDPRALYLAIKGGSPALSHAHMDAGSFVLTADGVEWATDLGMQSYESLEKLSIPLWAARQGGRWTVFRLGPESHNIPRFNNARQIVSGTGTFDKSQLNGADPHAILNLTSLYEDQVARIERGVRFVNNKAVLFQDEWESKDQEVEYRWQFMTSANAEVKPGRVNLSKKGKTLTLLVLDEAVHDIKVQEADSLLQPYDTPNPGVRRISILKKTPPLQKDSLRILALPGSSGEVQAPAFLSCKEWK